MVTNDKIMLSSVLQIQKNLVFKSSNPSNYAKYRVAPLKSEPCKQKLCPQLNCNYAVLYGTLKTFRRITIQSKAPLRKEQQFSYKYNKRNPRPRVTANGSQDGGSSQEAISSHHSQYETEARLLKTDERSRTIYHSYSENGQYIRVVSDTLNPFPFMVKMLASLSK